MDREARHATVHGVAKSQTWLSGWNELNWNKCNKVARYKFIYRNVLFFYTLIVRDFPGGSEGKESACNAGNPGLIPGSGKSPGEGNGYSLQSSCLWDPIDRGHWQATAHGIAKGWA